MNTKSTPPSVLHDIAQIQHMERGTLNVLRQGPRGPYYNHQCYEEGRNVSRYVPAERVDEIREAIQGYHRCSVPRFFRELFPFGFVVKREGLARC